MCLSSCKIGPAHEVRPQRVGLDGACAPGCNGSVTYDTTVRVMKFDELQTCDRDHFAIPIGFNNGRRCHTKVSQAVVIPRALQGLLCAAGFLLHLRRRQHALLLRAHASGLHPAAVPPHVPVPTARVRPVPNGALGLLYRLRRTEALTVRPEAQCCSQPLWHVLPKHAGHHIFLRLLLEMGVRRLDGMWL